MQSEMTLRQEYKHLFFSEQFTGFETDYTMCFKCFKLSKLKAREHKQQLFTWNPRFFTAAVSGFIFSPVLIKHFSLVCLPSIVTGVESPLDQSQPPFTEPSF